MKKSLFIIFINLIIGLQVQCQINFKLIGEGTENQVKLLWIPEKWQNDIDGVVIKRREISKEGHKSEWIVLSQTTIHPGNWIDKDLSNISNSTAKITELQALRLQFSNNTKPGSTQLKNITEDYIKTELSSPNANTGLIIFFSYDYDIALLMGFGYIDAGYSKNDMLEYGLYTVKKGIISALPEITYQYKTGVRPDLSFIVKKNKIKLRQNVVHLDWIIDTKNFRLKDNLVGFNIYRKSLNNDYKKINATTIWINKSADEGSLSYSDTIPDEKAIYSYGLTAVSIFKNESEKFEVNLKPQNYVEDILPPIIESKDIPTLDFVTQGVSMEWTFKKEQEPTISGFIIERKLKSEDSFTALTDTLPATIRQFHDTKVPSPLSEHYFYRVNAVRKDDFPLFSNQLILFYNPKIKLEKPKAFTAIPVVSGNNVFVNLKWSGNAAQLKSIKGYTIFCDRAWGTLAREAEIPIITGFDYSYKVEGVSGTKYLFAIAPVDKDGILGESSDTLSVMIPTQELPHIRIWPIDTISQKVIFEWTYPNNIPDLAGFRIYQNGILVATNSDVRSDQRKWSSATLQPGKYSFTMEAITIYGIISEMSQERFATIKKKDL